MNTVFEFAFISLYLSISSPQKNTEDLLNVYENINLSYFWNKRSHSSDERPKQSTYKALLCVISNLPLHFKVSKFIQITQYMLTCNMR